MIRPARPGDIPALVRMGREFHKQSGIPAEWDDESFLVTLFSLMNGDAGIVLVAGDDPVGMTSCILFPLYFNGREIAAQEMFWWVEPEQRSGIGRALIDELEAAAKAKGATVMLSSAIAGLRDAAVARLYAMKGYRPVEHSYIKRL